jgi:hypothetical protein
MKENTFTYTARSARDPEKFATFTLDNGNVSVQLDSALMEQAEKVYESFRDEEAGRLTDWIKPVATGSLQRLLKPIDLADFNAKLDGETLQTTVWIRAGGLRLAPIMMSWQEVDNPDGASAFVDELQGRKEAQTEPSRLPVPFNYWAGWLMIGLIAIMIPIILLRQLKKRETVQAAYADRP